MMTEYILYFKPRVELSDLSKDIDPNELDIKVWEEFKKAAEEMVVTVVPTPDEFYGPIDYNDLYSFCQGFRTNQELKLTAMADVPYKDLDKMVLRLVSAVKGAIIARGYRNEIRDEESQDEDRKSVV